MDVSGYFKDLKKTEEFLNTKGKKMLFYHSDADGVCSAALLLKHFSGFDHKPRRGPEIESSFVNYLIEEKPDVLVFVDMPVDQSWDKLQLVMKKLTKTKLVIIDHHIPGKDLNSKNIVHVNPRLEDNYYLPASYLVYKMIELMKKDVEEYMWIAVMGVIGDFAKEDTKDIIAAFRKKYPKLIGKDTMNSKMTKGVNMIASAVTMKANVGIEQVLDIIQTAKNYEEFADTSELKHWDNQVNKEIDEVMKTFKKEKKKSKKGESELVDFYPELNLLFYIVNTEFGVTSTVANKISVKMEDTVVIIARKTEKGYKVSARNQTGRVNTGAVLKESTKGIGGGGGHEQASGAFVTDWGMFKSRVIRKLKSD
ncbi:MAG: DHHA1 domain-containing protein [Candidatus Aenigmatarchaeota archaeon]